MKKYNKLMKEMKKKSYTIANTLKEDKIIVSKLSFKRNDIMKYFK